MQSFNHVIVKIDHVHTCIIFIGKVYYHTVKTLLTKLINLLKRNQVQLIFQRGHCQIRYDSKYNLSSLLIFTYLRKSSG